MNILDVQNKLKNFSEEQLVQETQAPTGNAPQFLVLSEIQRRKRMRDDLQQQQAQPVKTVAEEAIAAGGVPQGGIGQLAGAMGQGSSNAQMPQQQAPEQQPQGMYGGGIVKLAPGGAVGGKLSLRGAGDAKAIIVDENGNVIAGPMPSADAKTIIDNANTAIAARNEVAAARGEAAKPLPGGAVGGDWKPSRMSIVDVGNGKVNIVDENGGVIHGPLPSLFAQGLVNDMNAQIDADNEATGAAQQPETPPEPSFLDKFMGMFSSGDNGPSQTERMEQGASAPPAFANKNVRIGQPTDRGGIGAMLEATAQPAPEQTGVTPAAIAAINQSSGVNRGVPLAALEERMKKARMGIAGTPDFSNPADVMEPPNPLQGISENIGQVPALMPNYGPPGSGGQGDGSSAERFGFGVLKDTPIAKTFAEFGNVPSIFDLQPKDTERRDPSGEPPKQTTTATKPDGGVKKPDSNADDPKSPGATSGGGFGAMSPYESELMNMLKSKEKQAEQDKWMSLAKAGLAMMSSKSPNFGVAFGEGAASGLEDYQAQKSQYETDRLALLGGIEKSRLGREAAARAAQGKPDRLSMNSIYTGLQKQLEAQFRILSDSMYEDEKAAAMAEIKNLRARMSQIESTVGLVDLDATKIS